MKNAFARTVIAAALGTTSLLGFSVSALAQDAAPAAAPQADAQADAPTGEDSGAIIVTARRRSETLQSTPLAITAISTAVLESKAAVNIGDLQGAAPGLLITQQNSGAQAANISIRGLTYADIEKSQTPTVGVVVDGVTIGTNTGQLQDAFDIAQIEVLRGPQGTLFGANTIGGVINIQRTAPTMEPGFKGEVTYGRFNTWAAKAIANYGNGETWGVKLFYLHNQTDGFYRNVTRNSSAGASKGDTFGGTLLFKPTGSGFDLKLTVENVVQSFEPVVSNITNASEVFCGFIPANECNRNTTTDLYTTFGIAANSKYNAPDATLEMNYDLGGVKLSSITGWRKSKEAQTQDFDGSSVDLYYVDRRQNYTQWSQELRAAGNLFDGFDYVVGGFFFKSNYDLTQWSRVFGFSPNTPPTQFDLNSQHVEGETTSFAGFGDFNWAFADKFRLSFGGRWSHDNKKLLNGFAGGKLIDPANVNASQFVTVGSGNASFSKFTPKVGIDYRPNSDMLFYGSWSRGYRSGGFSPRAATAATASTPFQPETVDAFEIGAKLATPDHNLEVNIAGYISDYKNMQQNLTLPGGPTGNQTVTGNVAGGAIIKGIEIDGTWRVTPQFKITASGAYMDSKFRNFVANGALPSGALVPFDYSANKLIYAPKFTSSINAEYTVPTSFGKVVANVGWRHISPYDQQISIASTTPIIVGGATTGVIVNGNDPRVRTATQELVDASLSVNFKLNETDAYVRVFGRNLADTRTSTHAFTVAGLWSFAMALEPRTYGATVGVKF
jgi:iron complex outermembrane recepter protein